MNADYNLNLYRWQDANTEIPPKHFENRPLGVMHEAVGDIFRELTGRQQPDGVYIGEKLERIERYLTNPIDRGDIFGMLSEDDQGRADTLKERWFSLKGLSPRLVAVRNLNIAFADQNEEGVRFNLRRFKKEWTKRPLLTYRRPSIRPEVRVHGHRRRA